VKRWWLALLLLGLAFSAFSGIFGQEGTLSNTSNFRVAAVQYPVLNGRGRTGFLQQLGHFVEKAKKHGARLIVFPELSVMDLVESRDGVASDQAKLARIAREDTPEIFKAVIQLSRESGVAILAGSFPRQVQDVSGAAQIRNTAFLAFPDGKQILQDKLFLTPDEVAWGWQPGDELRVFEAPWGRTAILICYDSQFPSLSNQVAAFKPEVLLVPSMTGTKGLERVRWTSQARAVEHHAYVVVAGAVNGKGDRYAAQAEIVTPQEEGFPGVMATGSLNQEAIVYGDLDLTLLRKSRDLTGLYSTRDQAARKTPISVVGPK